jgi:hypothetical protein
MCSFASAGAIEVDAQTRSIALKASSSSWETGDAIRRQAYLRSVGSEGMIQTINDPHHRRISPSPRQILANGLPKYRVQVTLYPPSGQTLTRRGRSISRRSRSVRSAKTGSAR